MNLGEREMDDIKVIEVPDTGGINARCRVEELRWVVLGLGMTPSWALLQDLPH